MDKNVIKPSYRKSLWKNFRQCSKGCHAIFNTEQKISVIKFSPMRAGGKIAEIFSSQKFPRIYSSDLQISSSLEKKFAQLRSHAQIGCT